MSDWKPIASFNEADGVVVDLWIEVPPDPENYEVRRGYRVTDAYRINGTWFCRPCVGQVKITAPVTHWMPLPEAPKKKCA